MSRAQVVAGILNYPKKMVFFCHILSSIFFKLARILSFSGALCIYVYIYIYCRHVIKSRPGELVYLHLSMIQKYLGNNSVGSLSKACFAPWLAALGSNPCRTAHKICLPESHLYTRLSQDVFSISRYFI